MFDIIGDVHGCFNEFKELTLKLGYEWKSGIPIHPDGRELIFVGDITDRGPMSVEMIEIVWTLVVEKKKANYSPGNHCDKLYRYLKGNPVKIINGLETTVSELNALLNDKNDTVIRHFIELFEQAPLYLVLDDNKLVTCHAGIRENDIGKTSKAVKTFVLYGDITGKKNLDGTPERRDWASNYTGATFVVYGHTPVAQPRWINNSCNIDTGAVFGGSLTALRYPEKVTVSVPSSMPFVKEKFREL